MENNGSKIDVLMEEHQYNKDMFRILSRMEALEASNLVTKLEINQFEYLKNDIDKLYDKLEMISNSDFLLKDEAIMEIGRRFDDFQSNFLKIIFADDGPMASLRSEFSGDIGRLKTKLENVEEEKDSNEIKLKLLCEDMEAMKKHIESIKTAGCGKCSDSRGASKVPHHRKYGDFHDERDPLGTLFADESPKPTLHQMYDLEDTVHSARMFARSRSQSPLAFLNLCPPSRFTAFENFKAPAEDPADDFQLTSLDGGQSEIDTRDDRPTKTAVERLAKFSAFKTVLLIVFAAALVGWYWWTATGPPEGVSTSDYSRCAEYDAFRCENGGSLIDSGTSFACECADGYYGEHCSNERYSSMISRFIGSLFPNNEYSESKAPSIWWSFLPFTWKFQQNTILTFYQDRLENALGAQDGDGGDSRGAMTHTRLLPAKLRSAYCPVESDLPPLDSVYDRIFQRKSHRLVADPKKRNLLLHTFHQYFVLQFFGADFDSTVTGSQLYGADEETRRNLRSWSDGKLRTENVDGQQYPPRLSFVGKLVAIFSDFMTIGAKSRHWFDRVTSSDSLFWPVVETLKPRWALGHPLSSSSPSLFIMSTLWVREHNRVCDQLVSRWPSWTDEQVYNTARQIVLGEMMAIMVEDVLNAGSPLPMKHDPEAYRDRVRNVSCPTAPFELLLTIMLPTGLPKVPDYANVLDSILYGVNDQVLESGVDETVRLMVDEKMGTLTSHNDGPATEPLTKLLMKLSRENAVQGFNEYREHLGLRPYQSFYELTGQQDTADALEELYGNVDKVELLTGVLAEQKRDDVVSTFTVITNGFIMNSISTNPIYSKTLWESDTFGGEDGFDMVKSANMKSFVSNNLVDDFAIDVYAK